jgi:hypothetical protein
VFTDLVIKDLRNIMELPRWNYGPNRSKYYTRRMRLTDSLSNRVISPETIGIVIPKL